MSAFLSVAGTRVPGLPLRGEDYTVRRGDATVTKSREPVFSEAEGSSELLGYQHYITVDHPGSERDVAIRVAMDYGIDVTFPDFDRSVRIRSREESGSIKFERWGRTTTLKLENDQLQVDRNLSRNDVTFKDRGWAGFKIDRSGARNDVQGGSLGRVRRGHNDRLPSPEALALVDHCLDNGLNLDDMVTIGPDGQVTVWDEKLL